MPRPNPHDQAAAVLAAADPVLAGLVARHGPVRMGRRPRSDERFEALARSIAFQQLAGAAATAIWGRVRALVPGPLTPEALLALDDDALAAAGLSGPKRAALTDLARHAADGRLPLRTMGRLDDAEVERLLVQVRGIGPWTAHMFLLFTLRRPDVWPTGDLGVRVGYARAYGMGTPPSPRELEALGERFRPHRSTVAWYCWRAADTTTPS